MKVWYTVPSAVTRAAYVGNGATTVFSAPFNFFETSDLDVILVNDTTGVETVQVLTTNYTVTGGGGATGSVTMIVAPPTGTTLVIERDIPFTQEIDLEPNDPFPAEVTEEGFDRATMLAQQNRLEIQKSPKLPSTYDPDSDPEIRLPLPEAGQILVGRTDEEGWENGDIADLTGTLSAVIASPQDGDALVYYNGTWRNVAAAITVVDLAELKALTTRPNAVLVRTGKAAGVWQWVLASATTADDALVVQCTSGTAGRYKRIYTGPLWLPWFGALCDSTTNDHAAIVAAIDCAAAMGGATITWHGYCRNDSVITPTAGQSNVVFRGQGDAASWVFTSNHNFTHFNLPSTVAGWGFHDFGFYHTNGGTGATPVYCILNAGDATRITGVRFLQVWHGVKMVGPKGRMHDCTLNAMKPTTGIGVQVEMASNEVCHMSHLFLECPPASECYAGIQVLSCADLQLSDSTAAQCGTPLFVQPGNSQIATGITLTNWSSDSSDATGAHFEKQSATTGVIQRVRIVNSWFSSNAVHGIRSVDVASMTVLGSKFLGNTQDGISYTGTGKLVATGNVMAGNGGNGFNATANSTGFIVTNNIMGPADDFSGNTSYGAFVAIGTSDKYIIAHNELTGNTAGTLSDGGTGVNKTITPNIT